MMTSRSLIGNLAPDFEATAVFDEEFVPVKLSDYRGLPNITPTRYIARLPTQVAVVGSVALELAAYRTYNPGGGGGVNFLAPR